MIKDKSEIVYSLCIIGSGPAGFILAMEFAKNNPDKKVILIEYGSDNKLKENSLDNSIHINNLVNHHSPYECTNKGLGGTSATWGGRCVMYDEIDFMQRPVVGMDCTWDKDLFNELKAFLGKASKYFECGKPEFNLNENLKFRNKRIAENFKEGIVTDSMVERWSMPTRFGKRYTTEIQNMKNLTILEGFEGRDFSEPDKSGKVEFFRINKVGFNESKIVYAENFVLAAGAQESTRILLRNKWLFNNLDNPPASLGKYYQGHLSGKIASVKFYGDPKKTEYGFLKDDDGIYVRRRFQFDKNFLLESNLLNTAIWLDNPLYHDPKHRSGAMSFMYLAMITPVLGKKLAPPAIAHSITKGKVTGLSGHFLNIIRDFPSSILVPISVFYKRYCLKRKLPGVFLYSPDNRYALHFHSEQIPYSHNNMELSDDGDKLMINYSLTDEDIGSIIKLHKVLDDWLQKCNCGKLEYWFPEIELPEAIRSMSKDGLHQSGTTRIADTPEKGVVDENLKLFGTSNVFVCSSSVFPTSGQANPTYYLGAFAVRLADYITRSL